MTGTTLRVLTLNMWGVPVGSRNQPERFEALPKHIKDYDVCVFQEVFSDAQFAALQRSEAHPYAHRFISGLVGAGLAVLSKHEIVFTSLKLYHAQGKPEFVHHGDYFSCKGVALITVNVGGTEVDVYTTHTHACYQKYSVLGSHAAERYAGTRMSQFVQLASFVMLSSLSKKEGKSRPVIVAGDLNCDKDSPELILLQAMTGLRPTMTERRPTFTAENPFNQPDETSNIVERALGVLFNSGEEDLPAQLDHIFVSEGFHVETSNVVFTDPNLVAKGVPLSDHYGLQAVITLRGLEPRSPMLMPSKYENQSIYAYATKLLRGASSHFKWESKLCTLLSVILALIPVLLLGGGLPILSMLFGFASAVCFVLGVVQRISEAHALEQLADDLELTVRQSGRSGSGSSLEKADPPSPLRLG